jgi:mannose-6-phosphate isomerase-like protein (cupin superfamily)
VPVYQASAFPAYHVGPPDERFARLIMSPETTGYATNSVFLAEIPPGGAIPDHTHPENDEIMYFVGTGEGLCDGKRFPLTTDSVMLAPRGTVHGIWNTSATEPLKLFCVFVPAQPPQERFKDLTRRTIEYLSVQH